jgi:hypothetical protein
VRNLRAACADGRVEDVIKSLAAWPPGKLEGAAWYEFRAFGDKLVELHEKKGGAKVNLLTRPRHTPLPVFAADRVTEATESDHDQSIFVRVGELDIDYSRLKPGQEQRNRFDQSLAIVAVRGARLPMLYTSQIVLVGGPLELPRTSQEQCRDSIFVCGGDVKLEAPMSRCILIARGKITCRSTYVGECRLISGQSITIIGDRPKDCVITEKEPNPLGFIRWSDAPKGKSAPKSK